MIGRDGALAVELDCAALLEQPLELAARSLHAGLHPGHREAELMRSGDLRHRRGVTIAPALYVVGLRFQHRRNASFIDGARHDAEFIANHLAARDRSRDPLGI